MMLGAVIFLPGLGQVNLFDWDEINFAEISREMMVLENYSQPHVWFLPFWQKPPLFFWLQVLSMKMFGVTEFAARFPNALCGIITLPVIFHIGRKLYDEKFGLIWALAYLGALLPNLYFQSGIIDPVFNLFIFLGLWYFMLFVWKRRKETDVALPWTATQYLLMASLFTGLAVLTKGPAALIILCLCYFVYWIFQRFRWYITIPQFLLYMVATVMVSGIWYGTETLLHGTWFIEQFLRYNYQLFSTEDAGHGGFPGYHFVVVFIGCFPASLFLFKGMFKQEHAYAYRHDAKRWMLILLWVVLILFSVVQSKIIHYSSMTYFPLTYMAALVIWEMLRQEQRLRRDIAWGISLMASIFGLALVALPFIGLHIDWLQEQSKDTFARANMNADAGWTGFEAIAGLLLLISSLIAVYFMRKGRLVQGVLLLFFGSAVAFKLAMLLVVPKVEAYSQRAAIDFYKSLEGQDVYIQAVAFKTYADIFYAKLQPENKPRAADYTDKEQKAAWENWLINGDIDKPVFFITRVDKETVLDKKPDIVQIGEKNGFVMYKRNVPGQ